MSRLSTKQRRAARRRRVDPDAGFALAVAAFRRAMEECRPDIVRAVAENVRRNNTLLGRLSEGA